MFKQVSASSVVSFPQRSQCEKPYVGNWITNAPTWCLNLCENSNSTELLALKSTVAAGMLLIPGTIVFCCLEDVIYMNIYALCFADLTDLLLLQHLEVVIRFSLKMICDRG